MADKAEISGELQPDLKVEWKDSTTAVFGLDDIFTGERSLLYDRADFRSPVERVTIITGESQESHEPELAAQIQFEAFEPAPRNPLMGSMLDHDDIDPIKRFLGHESRSRLQQSSLSGLTAPESAFGPQRLDGSQLNDGELVIIKTVFPNIFKVDAGQGVKFMVWVDQERRRIVVTNNRRFSGTLDNQEHSVEVQSPVKGTVDRRAIAEGFFKTIMRTVDFSIGVVEGPYQLSARHYSDRRTYLVGADREVLQAQASDTSSDSAEESGNDQPNTKPSANETVRRAKENRYQEAVPEIKKPEGLSLDDIGGLTEIKRILKDVAVSFQHADVMKKWGAERPQGVLLYGPPGTGKTMLATALAAEIEADMMMVQGSDVYGMWMGESENRIKEIFKAARQHQGRLILFFDEIESIIGISTGTAEGSSSTRNAVAGLFKQELNTLAEENPNVLIVGATNFLEQIDPSLIRSGRFDIRVRVPMPDQEARIQIFESVMSRHEIKTGHHMFRSDIDREQLATLTDGLSGADISEIFRRLFMDKAMHEARSGTPQAPVILQDEIVQAIAHFKENLQ